MIRELARGRDYRLVNRESEGERGESVVSEKSEKRAERGEKRSLGVVSCLTYIGYPPQLRALHEKILEKLKKNFKNFYEEFIRPPRKFNKESTNLIRFSHIDFYKLPI